MNINVEWFGVAVDRDVSCCWVLCLDRVEDLATDPVHADHRGPILREWIVGVGGTWDGDPVGDTLGSHQAASVATRPGDGE